MPTDAESLTLALALTAGGAVFFAGLITGVIEIISRVATAVVEGHEQLLALILSAVVVLAAMGAAVQADVLTLDINSIFAGFLAWYGITRIAMGIHDDVLGRGSAGESALGNSI